MARIALINGSPRGTRGNSAAILRRCRHLLEQGRMATDAISLADSGDFSSLSPRMQEADGFLFSTGTYWDSWGSPLQAFLESFTATEGTEMWLGKPAAVVVTMHSVGGKQVLSRLQGVLNTFGVALPPLSGMAYSAVNQMALLNSDLDLAADLWCWEDLEVVCHNLATAVRGERQWRVWPVDRTHFNDVWLPPNSP